MSARIVDIDPATGREIIRRPNRRKKRPAEATNGTPIVFEGPPQVFCYVRVSTHKQDQSPADQRQVAQRLAEQNNLKIDAFFQDAPVQNPDQSWNDAQSGKVSLADRPAGGELCRRLRPGAGDVVIVSKMDRLFRKLSDCVLVLDRWERLGVRLLAGDFSMLSNLADPYSKALLQMMGVFAELERKLIRQRTKEALACRKREHKAVGFYCGYGFKFEKRFSKELGKYVKYRVADPEERQIMKQIVQWRMEGSTWDQLYFHLSKLGIRTRKGTEWSRNRIFRVFHAELALQIGENKRS